MAVPAERSGIHIACILANEKLKKQTAAGPLTCLSAPVPLRHSVPVAAKPAAPEPRLVNVVRCPLAAPAATSDPAKYAPATKRT
jgi:hypothetical protein